jgi:hypothetical protein
MRKNRLTTPIWAEAISVERKGECLIVAGKNHRSLPVLVREMSRQPLTLRRPRVDVTADLLAQSVPLASWSENRRKKPPHIEFANASTDAKLIQFCMKWGPFDGSPARYPPAPDSPRGWNVAVRENLQELRGSQKAFSGMARLIAEIQSNKPNPERFFQYYAQICHSLPERESFFDLAQKLNRSRPLANAAREYVQIVVCTLLNYFPPYLYPTADGPVELPPLDLSGGGVKHALYCFLRLEYLRKDRRGVGVCPNCDDVFAKERKGAVFCCEDCSKLYRSLEYYREVGRAKRQEKTAASKSRSSPSAPSKRMRT